MNTLVQDGFHCHSRHSFKMATNLVLYKQNLNKSLFNNCNFFQCEFKNCDFSETQWFGMQLQNCTFIDCNFSEATFKSCWIKNVTFKNCDFNDSEFFDNSFIESNIDNCESAATFRKNYFDNCAYRNVINNYDSYYNNQFTNCKFFGHHLDSAFYYNFFINTLFEECIFDGYILGYQYGITVQQLKKNKFTLFSDDEQDLTEEFLFKLKNIYVERKLILCRILLEEISLHNENLTIQLIDGIKAITDSNNLLQVDDLRFVRSIVDFEYNHNINNSKIIYFVAKNKLQTYNEDILNQKNINNIKDDFIILVNCIYFICMNIEKEIEENSVKLQNLISEKTIITIKYKKKPDLRICDLMFMMSKRTPCPKVLNTYTGSFIEEFILNNESYINLFAALITILGFGINTIKNIVTSKKKSQLHLKETNKREINVQVNIQVKIVIENYENIYNDYSKNNILDIKFEEKN